MNILIAEDNPQSRYLLEQFLAGQGFTVWSASDGHAGLELCRERGAPDVIVSDALMPGMDGFELCYALRNDPALQSVPFILYTATYTESEDEVFARSVGVDRFVIKPVEMRELLDIIHDVVNGNRNRPSRDRASLVQRPSFFEEHSRLISIKLEDKVDELSRANAALAESERAVRELNERLIASVHNLKSEVQERRRVEQLLRQAQSAGGVGTWVLDTASQSIRVSAEARKILGDNSTAGERSFEAFLALFDEASRARIRDALLDTTNEPASLSVEARSAPLDSRPSRDFLLCGELAPARDGHPTQRLGILQDITERKQAEARRQQIEKQMFRSQKMEALGNMAGGIAHDFNNILAAILLNAEMAALELSSGSTEAALRALREIVDSANRSREIIRQILTFSRGESTERSVAPLAAIVRDGIQLVRPTLDKRIELVIDLDCKVHILASENPLHQVLLNLCTNAAHAMRKDGGVLTVRLSQEEITPANAELRAPLPPGSYARLDVRDTGTGMPAELIEHIFEPYFTTKDATEGTGLGLAVVHGAVRAHNGAVFVDSAPGRGTTFSLYFPAVPSVFASDPAKRPDDAPQGQGELIMIVDDEPSVARSAAQFVERLGYRARFFTDPVEAREAFTRESAAYSLAIVDFLMPRLTGPDLAKAMWGARPGLPIILVAGFGGQMDAARARAQGFQTMLAKPFTKTNLAETIARALQSARTP